MNTDRSWQGASFESAALAALQEGAKLSMAEKIRWIEDAEDFGLRFQRRRWRAGLGVDPRFVEHLRFEDRGATSTGSVASHPVQFQPPAWFTSLGE